LSKAADGKVIDVNAPLRHVADNRFLGSLKADGHGA
jgi:hypothetical protein